MVPQSAYEKAKALAAQQAAGAKPLTAYEKAKALGASPSPATVEDGPQVDPDLMNPDSVVSLRPHRLTDVVTSEPVYKNVDETLHAIRVQQAIQKIKDQGGVPHLVEAASSFVDASQAGFANQIDAIRAAKEGDRLKALGINVRTALGSLPFVPAREPSDEARAINEAIQVVKAQQAKDNLGHAIASTAGSLGGVVYGLNVAGAPAKIVSGGIQAARGVEAASALSKALTAAAQFGTYEAMPALESGEPVDAAKDFGKGAAVGLALEATGGLAGKLPLPFLMKPAAQTAALSGIQYAETGELPSKNEAIALGLVLAVPGAISKLAEKPSKPKSTLRDPTLEEVGMAKDPIQAKPIDPMQQWGQSEAARAKAETNAARAAERRRKIEYLKQNKTLKGYVPSEGETFLTNAGQKPNLREVVDPATGARTVQSRVSEATPTESNEAYLGVAGQASNYREIIDPATGSKTVQSRLEGQLPADPSKPDSPQFSERQVIEAKPSFPHEPAFEAVLKGNRWIYLDPKGSVPTETELAFRKSPPSQDTLNKFGISAVDTSLGKAYVNTAKMREFFANNPDLADLAVKDSRGNIDPSATIANFAKRDMVGALLGYGKGNESKIGATHTVTARTASGQEIASIMAKNPETAKRAAMQMGAKQIDVDPVENVGNIIKGRRAAAKRSRESGFIAFGPKPKTPNERRLAMEDEYVSSPKNLVFPQYQKIARAAPEVYYNGVRAMSSFGASVRRASDFVARFWERLGGDPEKVDLFMRNLNEAQGVGLRAQGRNPGDALFMTPEQRAKYRANREQFEGGYKTIDEIADYLKEFEGDAGLKPSRPIPDGERYFRITSLRTPEARKRAYERAKRAGLTEGFVTDPSVMSGDASPVQAMSRVLGIPFLGAKKAGSSKTATGQTPDIAIEPFTVFQNRIFDTTSAANHNRFREAVRGHKVEVAEGEVPKPVEFDGKMEPVVRIDLGQKPDWMKTPEELTGTPEAIKNDPIYVPKPIADMFMDYLRVDPQRQDGIVSKASEKLVGMSLAATGADAIVHLTAGVDMLSQIPGIGKTVSQRLAAQGGITRNLVAIREMADMTSPENQGVMRKLESAGLIRQREYGPQAESGLERFSPFAKVTDWMFKPGGAEDAIKVGIYNLVSKYAPELSEAQKLYTVGQIGGVYTRAMQPYVIQRTPLALAPFVNMGVTKFRNAMTMLGGRRPDFMVNNKGVAENTSAEIAWKYTSTVLSFLALSYAVGDDKSFEEVLQHPTTIKINGMEYPISRFLSPISDFAGRVSGLTELVRSKSLGYGPEGTAWNVVRSPLNAALGYVGPLPSMAMGALGMAPYLTQDGTSRTTLMPSGNVTDYPWQDIASRAAWRAIPYYDEMSRVPEDPNASIGDKILHAVLATAGMAGKKPMDVDAVHAKEGNADFRKMNEIASGIAYEVVRADEQNRDSLIKRLVESRFAGENRERGEARVRQILTKMARSRARGLGQYEQENDGN